MHHLNLSFHHGTLLVCNLELFLIIPVICSFRARNTSVYMRNAPTLLYMPFPSLCINVITLILMHTYTQSHNRIHTFRIITRAIGVAATKLRAIRYNKFTRQPPPLLANITLRPIVFHLT